MSALGLKDDCNWLGPLVLLQTVIDLGLGHKIDFRHMKEAEVVGSVVQTMGVVEIEYSYFNKPYERFTESFHILEKLIRDYHILFPPNDFSQIDGATPIIAATMEAKRDLTEGEFLFFLLLLGRS